MQNTPILSKNFSNCRFAYALLVAAAVVLSGCGQPDVAPTSQQAPSEVAVSTSDRGPVMIVTPAAEFEVLRSGYIRASLLKEGQRLTLDDPEVETQAVGDTVMVDGKEIRDFPLDLAHARTLDPQILTGGRGKRVAITAPRVQSGLAAIEKTMAVEVYDELPHVALTAVAYKNVGNTDIRIDQVVAQRHRLSASRAEANSPPYALWSFHGASDEWGKDEIVQVARGFSRPNVMGAISRSGAGGGVPVVAFWTKSVGAAIGHAELQPLVLSIPAHAASDGRVEVRVSLNPERTLRPGETYVAPLTFVTVYAGDFYEPLRTYSQLLQRRGWKPANPNPADFSANWCGWGYRSDVTPAQMLGTIPKLKELGFKWATLDYRWFNNFGDWEARLETFPADSLKTVVAEYHQQGIKVQLWWLPLAVSDGQAWEPIGPEERTSAAREQQKRPAAILKEHPDWLILDQTGRPARLFLNRAALCPALPAVQDYHRRLTEKFIRDWGFDGHKLDMCFTVPACYNPKHNHKTPHDSIQAMGEIFRVIFGTTRQIKPDSVTQICPCGTTPNMAWLPYMDQAVTADPVGALQVRRRIKMYKALLGPEAAVYGDHVELSEMRRVGKEYVESGADFASTVGAGGVLGTKFTWPDYGPQFKRVYLTPEKEAHWKKWIAIYNARMLSQGSFVNLYSVGYDTPEGYAIAKDGKMYYAFFAPQPTARWKGEIELRGLQLGRYRVFDYVNGKDLGTVDAANPRLPADFSQHLLLEVSKQ